METRKAFVTVVYKIPKFVTLADKIMKTGTRINNARLVIWEQTHLKDDHETIFIRNHATIKETTSRGSLPLKTITARGSIEWILMVDHTTPQRRVEVGNKFTPGWRQAYGIRYSKTSCGIRYLY